MAWAILDSNIYIGHWEGGRYSDLLEEVRNAFVIRHSSVVLSELRRGARTRPALGLVVALYRLAAVQWEPTAEDWWSAGEIIKRIGDLQKWEATKRRDFQNDAIIALTARRHGASIVTANRTDFALLQREIRFDCLFAKQ